MPTKPNAAAHLSPHPHRTPQRAHFLSAVLIFLILIGSIPEPALAFDPSRPTSSQETSFADPMVGKIMEGITAEDLYGYSLILTGEQPVQVGGVNVTLTNRSTYRPMLAVAVQYTVAEFQSMGLQVSTHTWDSNYAPNVIAEQESASGENCLYLLTAHLDNMPDAEVAPGADDNASGSAGVLAIARVFSRYSFRCTLRYVLFTGEEQGLWGSQAYAAQRQSLAESITGVINLDMIGYNTDESPPIFELYARSSVPGSEELAETFSQVVSDYNLDLTPEVLVDETMGDYSDNRSFWDYGYPAILAIEDGNDLTPFYHQVGDTVGTLNFAYFTAMTRAAAGTLLHLAELQQGWLEGWITAYPDNPPLEGAALRAENQWGDSWSDTSDAGGLYGLWVPTGTYSLTAEKEGYIPQTRAGVIVGAPTSSVENFSLPVGWRIFFPLQLTSAKFPILYVDMLIKTQYTITYASLDQIE